METPDILILGAGIIGCSLARELARANAHVVVLDRGLAGQAASSAAAGLLSPTLAASAAGPLADLCYQSNAIYAGWVEELRADGAGDVGYERAGLLEVWTDAEQAVRMQAEVTAQLHPERPIEIVSATEVRRREPGLVPTVAGGAFYPDDAQVEPPRLALAVARVAELQGVVIRENEPVTRLVRDGDRISVVETARQRYHPGTVVLAAGAWSGALAQTVGLHLQTHPVKGQMLLAHCRVAPVRVPVHTDHALLVPRPNGTLMLGVTVEEVGFDDRVTLDGVRSILDYTTALVPAVGQLSWARAWAGLRPATPDGWPAMGPLPPLHNLWVSTGHFRKGILLAPLCARLMAQSILAGRLVDDLQPFKPTRRS